MLLIYNSKACSRLGLLTLNLYTLVASCAKSPTFLTVFICNRSCLLTLFLLESLQGGGTGVFEARVAAVVVGSWHKHMSVVLVPTFGRRGGEQEDWIGTR